MGRGDGYHGRPVGADGEADAGDEAAELFCGDGALAHEEYAERDDSEREIAELLCQR